MLRSLGNIFWLGTKELRSLQRDVVLVVFVMYSFSLAIFMQARGTSTEVHNASIGLVDEDQSALTGRIANAFFEPNFQKPVLINADQIDQAMDDSRFMFVLAFPPGFEQKVIDGDYADSLSEGRAANSAQQHRRKERSADSAEFKFQAIVRHSSILASYKCASIWRSHAAPRPRY
jgi:hypothetical protein